MHADLKGSLRAIKNSWKSFENNGKPMDKKEVEYILKYGIEKGYKTTADFKDNEVDLVLSKYWWDNLAPSFQYYHLRKNEVEVTDEKSIVEMYNKKDLKLRAD
ncbi:hypothetical protein [Epilithonimonas xixisoli]|uniref:Uncharacterized protein n=1 Tax=Epilithonimonas xixisoli TaxID=1476462 RepID=A0A4R8IEA3_9FLAO|nr:hypothetical protein [Epilithonimonas xixisoli]TDX83980.1 hypothetical protein B0I22_1568 [Epilithonimonas xixisoli]